MATNPFSRITRRFFALSLGPKIYLSLTAILVPVFILTIFVQTKVTRPLLQEEVRQIGLSVCRSISSDIIAQNLLGRPEMLEARLLEMTWQQPSLVRIAVLTKETVDGVEKMKIVASNIDEETAPEAAAFNFTDPQTTLESDDDRSVWQILYPVQNKARNKAIAYLKADVSLQLVERVTSIFTEIASLGAILAIALLIWILSYYMKRIIENERRLRAAETTNIELTEQLHETQQQLFQNEKLAIMGQLTASFAHEIGTPLNSLSGHLQLLHDEVVADKSRNRIDIINSQVTRIEGIVKTFLASTHTPPQQKHLVDPRAVVERISNLVAPRLQSLKAQVQIDSENEILPLRAVPTDLEQVLINLTNNSLDALSESTKSERKLTYRIKNIVEGSKRTLEFSVSDNADGIKPADLKQVAKPFYTTKAPGKGTGLGLTICQQLVKKYGGKLELDSVLGKGTTVTIRIPYDAA